MTGSSMFIAALVMLAFTVNTRPVDAAVTLFDFESDQDISAWKLRTPATDSLKRSGLYATSGNHSMEFFTPQWKTGMEQWPAFEAKPPVADWREFDRLIIDITNTSGYTPKFYAYILDSKRHLQQGYLYTFRLPAKGGRRFVIDLSRLDFLDKSDISNIHFFTERPAEDLHIFLDNIILLKPGEKQPELPTAFLKQTIRSLHQHLQTARKAVLACESELNQDDPRVSALRKRVDDLKTDLESLDGMIGFEERAEVLIRDSKRLSSLAGLQQSNRRLGMPADKMLIGFATSMEKVLPKDIPVNLKASKSVTLSAARNEKESFQVAVTPAGLNKLSEVTITPSDLHAKDGSVLPKEQIECDVVGYVQTRTAPPYQVSYIGWWPDPILNFLGPVDVGPGDVQTFWVRVRVPKEQKPGVYKGTFTVSAKGVEPVKFGLSVKVRSFTMPDCTPLPTAITFLVPEYKSRIIKEICGTENWHKKLKYDYADFLADYYINYDNLYNTDPPDYEVLKYLHDKGKLVSFNYGYFGGDPQKNIERYKPIYEKCKELGIVDHSYIYGFDERPKEEFHLLEDAAKAMKEAFPDVLLMTTAYDASFGMDSVVKSIDAWCPLTPSFDTEKVKKARAAGKKVWWYICCGPQNPYANWFIEYHAIESRLLMGPMTAKYNPDGFLYYSLTYWNKNKPITRGPYTTWNPVSWTTFHGDGSLFCCGPDGKPVPTIRLENYRDGMEDFAYYKILENIVDRYRDRGDALTPDQRTWLTEAAKALEVPEKLVKALNDYSRDPKQLYAWREKMADLIDSSGMADADPWGKDFGVRGFDNK